MTLEAQRPIGTPGRVALLGGVVLAAVGATGWETAAVLGLAVLLALAWHPAGLRVLVAPWAWAMLTLLVLPAALIGHPPTYGVGLFRLSLPGLALGGEMALRAAAILVAASGFAATVPVVGVAALLDRVGVPGFGFALGVAINMLPVLQGTATTTWQAFRQRGGFRRRPLGSLRLILATVVSESLRKAEDVVAAAHARGFGSGRRPPAMPRGRHDLALALALSAAVALIWLR